MSKNVITSMIRANFLKETICQNSHRKEINHLKRPISVKETESVINKYSQTEGTRPRWVHWWVPPKMKQRNYNNFLQSLSEDGSRGNTSELILWGQHYPNTNTGKRHYNKIKLQTNIAHQQRCKSSQPNIRTSNKKCKKEFYTTINLHLSSRQSLFNTWK